MEEKKEIVNLEPEIKTRNPRMYMVGRPEELQARKKIKGIHRSKSKNRKIQIR